MKKTTNTPQARTINDQRNHTSYQLSYEEKKIAGKVVSIPCESDQEAEETLSFMQLLIKKFCK